MPRMFSVAREKVVGWYSTGPKIKSNDLAIHEVIREYTASNSPVYVIVEVQPKELGIPTKAYITVEEVSEVGGPDHLPHPFPFDLIRMALL